MANSKWTEIELDANDPRVIDLLNQMTSQNSKKSEEKSESKWEEIELDEDDPRVAGLMNRAGINLPKKEPRTAEKIMKTFLNGLLLGGAPTVAGTTRFAPLLEADGFTDVSKFLPEAVKEGKKTKKEWREDLDEFRDEHPIAATAVDFAGSIPVGMLPMGAVASGKKGISLGKFLTKGAKVGAGYGAVYGGIDSADRENNIKDIISDTLKYGLIGGGIGAGTSAIISKPFTSKVAKIVEKLGIKKVKNSIKNNVPLLEKLNDPEILEFTKSLVNDKNAATKNILKTVDRELGAKQKKDIGKIIDEFLTSESFSARMKAEEELAKKTSKPLYTEAIKEKHIKTPRTMYSKTADEYIALAKKVDPDLAKEYNSNMKVLKAAKELMDDEIKKLGKSGDKFLQSKLIAEKDKLLADMVEAVPQYGEANKIVTKMHRRQEALERGLELPKLQQHEIEALPKIKMNAKERAALEKIGYAQHFRNRAFNSTNPEGDMFKTVFADDDIERLITSKILSPKKVKELKTAVMGKRDALANLRNLANSQEFNLTSALSGLKNNPVRWATSSTKRMLTGIADKIIKKIGLKGNEEIIEMLAKPEKLAEALGKTKWNKNLGKLSHIENLPELALQSAADYGEYLSDKSAERLVRTASRIPTKRGKK
jgi:hypothetical protein